MARPTSHQETPHGRVESVSVGSLPSVSKAWGSDSRGCGVRARGRVTRPCSPQPSSPLSAVDHGMFENVNAAHAPKLQPSCSFPHLSRPAAPSSAALGSGVWVGSSQHLKNLGRAMGAKVNDFLRRKEPSSLDGAGAMEINRTAGARLAGGVSGEEAR